MSQENVELAHRSVDAFNRRDWRDRKVIWWHTFRDEAEALKAVGLAG